MSGSGHVIHKDKSQTPGQDSLLLFWKFIFLWNIYLSLKLEKNPPTTKEQVFIREEITCRSSQRRRGSFKCLQCDSTAFHSSARSASSSSKMNIQMLAAIIPAKEVFGCSEDSLMDSLREELPQKESCSEQRTMLAQEMMHTNRCKCAQNGNYKFLIFRRPCV